MYLSGGQTIQRSMNGLLKITASEIDTTNASITNINNVENISGAIGSDLVIDVDTGKIIQLKDNTQIDSSLNVIGNTNTGTFYVSNASTFNGSITCKGIVSNGVCTFNNPLIANSSLIARSSIDVSTNSLFRKNLSVSGQLSVGGTSTFDGLVNVTKQLEVFENATFEKNVIVNEGIYTYGPTNQIDGSLSVFGYTKLRGELDVSGNTTLKQLTTSKPATFNDAVICNSTFDSYGNTTFNNPVITNSTLDLYGMLTVSGISVFNDSIINYSSLDVAGITTLNGNATLNGDFNGLGSTNQFANSLSIFGSLNTTGNSLFRNNLDVSGNLYVGRNNPNTTSTVDLTGQFLLREPSNPNVLNMSIKYEPTLAGWRFINNNAGGFVYFSVKNSAGAIRNFQFSYGQLYSNINSYYDCDVNFSFNKQLTLGDTNFAGTWFGVSHKYIPSVQPHDGYVVYNKGLMNNATYYSNWVHVNTSNVDVPTMRMSWQGIESKVQHTMENNLIVNGNITLSTVGKNITFPDTTQQTTAFTDTLNTKLTAIGTRVTSTLNATVQLTTGGVLNCGSISLSPGTYMISVFCYIDTQNGTSVVNGLSAAYSTSPTAYSHNVDATLTGGGLTYALGSAWSLNTTDCVVVASTTTYYMITRCVFTGSPNRLRFVNPFSKFTAVRIA